MRIDSRKCPSCKAGFSPTTRRCPICGARLTAAPDAEAKGIWNALRTRAEPTATDAGYTEVVVLREAPVAWAREVAAALDFHGIPYNLEASPASRGAGEPLCRILVAQSDVSRAMTVDDEIYARQVPQSEGRAEGRAEWPDLLPGGRDDAEPASRAGAASSLIRTAAFILAMILFYVIRALLGD